MIIVNCLTNAKIVHAYAMYNVRCTLYNVAMYVYNKFCQNLKMLL